MHVDIIDISAGGVLVETHQRLLPGMPLDVHFERDKRIASIRGRVLRCVVARLTANVVSYRGAIGFDGQLPWLVEDAVAGSSFTTTEGQ